ncbi:hypothetical protein EV360DRAFT_76889 [Lentinula raphanica]|nr:hypothetical protein EV360DRAFT_76889 [Lentinula raphanica]
MAPKGKGSSSGKTQGASSRKIQFSALLLEVTFHHALRARDSLSNSADAILFLPSTPAESTTLQKLWRKFHNTLESAFKQPEFELVDDMDFPQCLPSDYQDQVPTNFYPSQLDAISEVQASNKSRAKTQANIVQLLEDPVIQNALKHYRQFWHRSRSCPLFALRFVCLFCDYCERYLEAAKYTRLVYDEARSTGFGVSGQAGEARRREIIGRVSFISPLATPLTPRFQSHTTPALKKQKTGKAAGKARAVTPTLSAKTDELEPALISEAAASSMAMDQLLANNNRGITRQVSFLANPDYKPRIAFSTLVSPGHNLKRCPDHQVLRMPKWVATPELASEPDRDERDKTKLY